MAASPNGLLTWNLAELAKALHVKESDVKEYFTDGRRISFLLERRIAHEVLGGKLAPSEGAGYDLIDKLGKKWEVRSITGGGIYFCPSYMVGSGRTFNEQGFLEKTEEIAGYIVSDIEAFPRIPFWVIPTDIVLGWWRTGQLGAGTKISRDKAKTLISKWKS